MEQGQTLAGYLKYLRKTHHYKQEDVASRLGIIRQTYSHYETGRIKPPAAALYKLARLYHVSMESMMSYQVDRQNREGSGSQEEQFLICFRCLEKEERERVLAVMMASIENRTEYGKKEENRKNAESKITV